MLTVGPRSTSTPFVLSSAPITCPYDFATEGSKEAATAAAAGSCVVSFIRTPTGPSCIFNAGTHNRASPGMMPV